MNRIYYLTNASENSGVGHRAWEMKKRLDSEFDVQEIRIDGSKKMWPKSLEWIRQGRTLKGDGILHVTNQSMSFVTKNWQGNSLVTVHDLIELQEPQSWVGGVLAGYLYSGVKLADEIVCVSEYTKQQVKKEFGLQDKKLEVIENGVSEEFKPIEGVKAKWLRRWGLTRDNKVLLFVGSEHPRKNLVGALKVLAKVRQKIPNTMLIKIGGAGLSSGRKVVMETIRREKLDQQVVLYDEQVNLSELAEIYNSADVLLYPSKFEGFGLPPLQAMACGLPVVTSNATSLPEVVGSAAIIHNPDDISGLATSVLEVLENHELADALRTKGLARAKSFSWDRSADRLAEIYRRMLAW